MDAKEMARRSNLLKFEATMLFTQIKAQIASERWHFFRLARREHYAVRIEQQMSPYRASLQFTYVFAGISITAFLEREAHVGNVGDDLWILSLSGIEGKAQAAELVRHLQPLRASGFGIPNGDDNLERQMNFSLGLYGECLMHVDVHFPLSRPPFECCCQVIDHLEQLNASLMPSLHDVIEAERKAEEAESDDDLTDEYIIYGDWQTWK